MIYFRLLLQLLLSSLLLFLGVNKVDSHPSSGNYNVYNYDLTTPQFTPDGRLLQVEYASLAATHSSPIVIWKLPSFGVTETEQENGKVTIVMTANSSKKVQNRLIPLSMTTAVALSGIISDSMLLLSQVHELQDNHRRLYGSKSRLTSNQLAQAIATSCQRHAFGGGLRPYGSTMVVLSPNTLAYQTDPSGAVWSITESFHVVGGGGTGGHHQGASTQSLHLFRRSLEQDEITAKSITSVSDALMLLAKQLLHSDRDIHAKDHQHRYNQADDMWLEVMILHKEQGIYKLTEDQIERLLARIREQP